MSDGSFERGMQHQEAMNFLITKQEFALVSLLKPKVFIDGNQWCVLYGESLQEGVAGFGVTPIAAVYAFNQAWHQPIPSTQGGGE